MNELVTGRVMVTGATGFIGRSLCEKLMACGYAVVPAVRRKSGLSGEVVVGDIGPSTDWRAALLGADVVVHLAARAPEIREMERDLLALYRRINTEATLGLARQAAKAGVKRFIFISTIKVNGEGRDAPYRETDVPTPEGVYAVSKWEAEQGLWHIARESGLDVVILRPPLVYGPGAKANFRSLVQWVRRGWPLPLGVIRNRRSLLYLGNLVDAIRVCVEHPAAAGQTFLLDDGQPVSTPELVKALGCAMDQPVHLLAVSARTLTCLGMFLGGREAVAKLTGSLWVDSSAIRDRLGWTPPYSLEASLTMTVQGA